MWEDKNTSRQFPGAISGGLSAQNVGQGLSGAGGAMMGECAARQSARGVLRQRIRSLRQEADRLEALAGALPEVLPEAADSALWDLLIGKR